MLWLMAMMAWGQECEYISVKDVTSITPPAVVILGERYGHQPDLGRAKTIVRKFAGGEAPVTVALEAVPASAQSVLDDFASGTGPMASDLPELLSWEETWGFSWARYEPLVTSALVGAKVVGIGGDVLAGFHDEESGRVRVPSRYASLLETSMADAPVPIELGSQVVEAMAWSDRTLAQRALAGWDEQGVLVIVVGRGRVEGGKGVSWQLKQLTSQPIHDVILASGSSPLCERGDRIID